MQRLALAPGSRLHLGRAARALQQGRVQLGDGLVLAAPAWSKAVESAAWRRLARAPEAVAGRPEGRPLPGSAELPRAARRALRRHGSRAGALPRKAL
eukprot:scaffold19718_cov64-Phaeocystis_antarctica.AAC.2